MVTTLEGAIGQTWGGVLFLDSNEGAWPIYPPENPFLDDAARGRLNEQRGGVRRRPAGTPSPSSAHVVGPRPTRTFPLSRSAGKLHRAAGFRGRVARPGRVDARNFIPTNGRSAAWSKAARLRAGAKTCWTAGGARPAGPSDRLPRLGKRDAAHLGEVFAGRRDPGTPFDEYFFNFDALTAPDELPFTAHWSARDLESAWNRPATFALAEIFGVEPWRDGARELARGEGWMIGRLVHRWLHSALRGLERTAAVERPRLATRPRPPASPRRARKRKRGCAPPLPPGAIGRAARRDAPACRSGGRACCTRRTGRRAAAWKPSRTRRAAARCGRPDRAGSAWTRSSAPNCPRPPGGCGCGRIATCCCSTAPNSPARPARSSTSAPARLPTRPSRRPPRRSRADAASARRRCCCWRVEEGAAWRAPRPARSIRTRRW